MTFATEGSLDNVITQRGTHPFTVHIYLTISPTYVQFTNKQTSQPVFLIPLPNDPTTPLFHKVRNTLHNARQFERIQCRQLKRWVSIAI